MSLCNKTLRQPAELIAAGLAPQSAGPALDAVARRYAIAITPQIAGLIDPSDPDDPIARQFIPDPRELDHLAQERSDPIGDELHSPVPGIVHRYHDRLLLKIIAVCPVYCRFCFRRDMIGPGAAQMLSARELAQALRYIAEHREIWEVIVTGGDPFTLSARRIADLTGALAAIAHVKIIRWHSRVPIVDPEHITEAFVAALQSRGATSTANAITSHVVIHANHPRELAPAAGAAIARLADAGIPLYSQSVLLKGVNDDADVLAELMRRFVELRIKPYYLHHGDLAPGTSHLRTTIAEGQALMAALRQRVSGLCLPDYVLDIPGGHGKVPIGPAYLAATGTALMANADAECDGRGAPAEDAARRNTALVIRDPAGKLHQYPPQDQQDQ